MVSKESFFYDLAKEVNAVYALGGGLARRGIPTKVPLVLSTGKVSHWKTKKNWTIKRTIKTITSPRESKAYN